MHISSPEQTTNCLPGHLSLGKHNSLQVGEVTESIAHIALATTDSWGFPLSPTSVQNVLTATPNPSPDQFQSIIAGLATTIWVRDNVHQEKVKGLEADIVVLQQRVDGKDDGLAKCPPGYKENRECFPNFTIPLNDGLEQFACFIKQLNNGRVTGLHAGAKGEEEAQIIELYTSPNYSTDKLMESLPSWICHCLLGDWATYALLEDTVNDLDDWGLLANVQHYHNMTKNMHTSPRRWSFWKPSSKASASCTKSAKSGSSLPASQTKSNTLCSIHLWGSFSQHGRGGAQPSHPESPPTRDEDVSI